MANQNTNKKYCCRGHELTIDNVYLTKQNRRICIKCVQIRRENNREKIKLVAQRCYQKHKEEYRIIRKIMRKSIYEKTKKMVLYYYGKGRLQCVCCGESNYPMLTLDHIQNNGNKERKIVRRTGHNMYRYLIKMKFPEGYQTLCFNCNSGKQINGGICPHKEKEGVPVILSSLRINGVIQNLDRGDLNG